ncbi:MAG: glycosyltransferase family 9 protein, partial [Alphaproteobacteria bacterium]|nr:glycosyltransferase family 9 protein [Alphaproteobacteria bacterium]
MKILFITSTRIGDAILSTGLISHLAKTYPNAKITVACGPPAAPLFEACPAVEQTIIMDKNASTSLFSNHWFLLWKETVRTRWDMVIDLRSSLTGYFLRANKRFLWSSTDSLSHHRVEQLGQVLKLSPPPSPTLWTRPIHIERA